MIIDKIEIFNHGPFYGKHEIKFDNDGEGVHIIRGNNGQGKTSIQRSILWGFYGEIKDRKGKEVPITSLVNRTSVKDFNLHSEPSREGGNDCISSSNAPLSYVCTPGWLTGAYGPASPVLL